MGLFNTDEDEELVQGQPDVAPVAPPAEEGTPAMNPAVKGYLSEKYMDQFSPEARQKIVDQNKEDAGGIDWRSALSALGAGLQGRDAFAAGQAMKRQQQGEREGRLTEFDKARGQSLQNKTLAEADEKRKADMDPNSMQSKIAQKAALKMNMDPNVAANMTAAQFREVSPVLAKMYGIDEGIKIHAEDRDFKADQVKEMKALRVQEAKDKADAKAAAAAEKEAYKKTTEGKLAHLNSSDKSRFDSAKMGYQAVDDMTRALKGGDWTFSPIGDNNFTVASRNFEEALGRMQSGGAINKDEEARFKKMRPSASDSSEMQKKKLQQIQAEMGSRLKTLGFSPDELGLSPLKESSEETPEMKIVNGIKYKKVKGGWAPIETETVSPGQNQTPSMPPERASQTRRVI